MSFIANIRIFSFAICIAAIASSCHTAEKQRIAEFEQQVEQIRADYQNVGLALVAVKNNKVVYSKAFGYQTLPDSLSTPLRGESEGALSPNHLFRIASISKSFTTIGILQQIEQGKTTLDTDAGDLLGFPLRNPAFPDSVITIERLLSHTSSINGSFYRVDDINPSLNPDYQKAYNSYAPGCGYQYCDFNITLAGAILEILSGCRFDEYIRKNILLPLGIEGGFNVDSLNQDLLVTLYSVEKDQTPKAYTNCYNHIDLSDYRLGHDTYLFAPASGLKISANGLATYMLMLMNFGTTPDGVTIVDSELAKDMYRQRFESYHHCGLTLLRTDDYSPGVDLYGHKGGAYGMRSAYYFHPEKKYGFIVISNGSLYSPNPSPLTSNLSPITFNLSPLYQSDNEGDTSIRVPLLRLMYQTFAE